MVSKKKPSKIVWRPKKYILRYPVVFSMLFYSFQCVYIFRVASTRENNSKKYSTTCHRIADPHDVLANTVFFCFVTYEATNEEREKKTYQHVELLYEIYFCNTHHKFHVSALHKDKMVFLLFRYRSAVVSRLQCPSGDIWNIVRCTPKLSTKPY